MYTWRDVMEVVRTTGRLLAFQRAVPDLKRLGPLYLAMGLLFAWIAGIGRYWDNPRAAIWQHLGLGSVAYVIVMAFLIWVLLLPLRPRNWHYRSVLIFVTLTSPPAFLYAVPVEKFLTLDAAQTANVMFLLTVATWRVAPFVLFLQRSAGLSGGRLYAATLLPILLVIVTLTVLNLERAVFEIMGGLQKPTADDAAYGVLIVITTLSVVLLPIVLLGYAMYCIEAFRAARRASGDH
jgi:hypothetical protein